MISLYKFKKILSFLKFFLNIIILIIILLLVLKNVYSLEFSEISFNEPEYIELYYNNTIYNLTNIILNYIYDESGGIEKKENLFLIKNKTKSNCILIINNDFTNYYNTNKINCSIYTNNKNSLGYYGLKDKGESIYINYKKINENNITNNNITISYTNNKILNLESNESLNFLKNKSTYINNKTPGEITLENIKKYTNLTNTSTFNNTFNESITILNNSNTNIENTTTIINNSICKEIDYEIAINKEIIEEKIEFNFNFSKNIENYTITYWVEDLYNNIYKSKYTTKNNNIKTYTPSINKEKVFIIKAELNYTTCSLKKSKIFIYKYNKDTNINEERLNNSINILNEKTINQDNYIDYKVYRGDTAKRIIKFYVNNNLINKIEIKNKFQEIEGRIYLNNIENLNTINIEGLDINKEIKIFTRNNRNKIKSTIFNLIKNNSFEKNKSKINSSLENQNLKKEKNIILLKSININQLNNIVNFTINTNIKGNLSCYILDEKTKISKTYNTFITNFLIKNLSLTYNNTKNNNIKLLCKIKVFNKSYFKYTSKILNLSKNSQNTISKSDNIKSNKYITSNLSLSYINNLLTKEKSYNNIKISKNRTLKIQNKTNLTKKENLEPKKEKEVNMKEKFLNISKNLIIITLSLITTFLIIKF